MQLNPITLTALGAIFGVLAASSLSKALRYTAPDECKWVSLRDAGGAGFGEVEATWEGAGEDPDDSDGSLLDDDGEGDDEEVSLFCRLRTINSELENTNFSAIQPRHTAALRLECSDALFFQSSLRTDSFRALTFLRTLSIEYCKLGSLPAGAFRGLTRLRRLTLRTHNADWSALALDVEKGAFSASDLPRLTHLDLSENNLWSLPPSVFCPLPLLRTLNLTKNRLRDVTPFKFTAPEGPGNPSSILDIPHCGARLQVLDLSNNSVESLPAGALSGLSRLRELRLEGNALSFVADGAFQGLTSLAVLRLSHNRLSSLPPELFASSRDLREIHLSNNSVSVLAPGLLAGLERLQLLDLSQNELTSDWVNGATLAGLVRLVVLDISHNRLGPRIDAAVFRDLYSLQILRLSDNVIEALPEAAFSALANLHTLVLSRNRLVAVRPAPAIPPVGMATVGTTSTKPETSPFSGLRALSLLALDGNSLMTLEADALSDCAGLQDLHINGNRLRVVPPGLSTTLPQLRTIDLGENAITAIDNTSFAPNGLPHLYGLRLTDNLMVELKRGALKALPALKILNLSRNRLSYIEPGAFDDNQALQAVRVDGNQLTEITGLFSKLPNLIWLNASDNRLEWFDYALIPTGLQWLDIHSNSIAELGSHFESESKLKLSTLDASSNKLTELSGNAVPDSVELLFLGDNRIERVQPYAFFRKPNLTRVDLMKNNITHLGPNSLRISAVSHTRTLPEFYIGGNPFACDCTMDWLQRVNNDGSRLRNQPRVMDLNSIYCRLVHGRGRKFMPLVEAAPSDFLCPYETHCFALCHCCDFDACDCEMTCPPDCICHHDQSWSANVVDCSTAGLLGLPARIPMDATEVYLDGNSLGKITSHAFIGRKRLRSLFLNASAIDTIANRSFNGLPDLRILYLQENLLGELKGYEFEGLPALQELYLQGNRLTSVAATTFSPLPALQILNLERNRIMSFSVWTLESNTALSSIRLSHNPWACDCDFLTHYREWLQAGAADAVDDLSKIRCYSIGNNTNLEGHATNTSVIESVSGDWEESLFNDPTITSFLLIHDNNTSCGLWGQNGTGFSSGNNFLTEPLIRDYLPLLIAALTVFVIVTFLSLLIFIYRLELRVWFHSRYGVRLFLFPSSSSSMGASQIGDSDKLFDAFISYSSKDEAFVAQELAPSLEPNYKLCLHYRDFPVGGYITDTIVQAVESSKRTIMVLSENFIRSEWCRFEFKSAHHRVLRDRRRRLIVIILGEVPPARELDPDIRLYLKTNTYLQWGDKLFWEKLRYALPDVPNNRRRGGGGGGGADVKK
ncbi:toll-like receptor Tollo [Hetaerina americana]|uniref:toll-like receptor Tollo n=1 Tax=Hetaerina americana TaxID=62018 RepID=UPI003A7F600A